MTESTHPLKKPGEQPIFYDRYLLLTALGLITVGLLMLASASVSVSDHFYHNPFHFLIRQVSFLLLGLILAILVLKLDLRIWQRFGGILLIVSIFLLAIVLIPGIG